jgi:[ribosomal protein S18]-alanine N-acetyltransferase
MTTHAKTVSIRRMKLTDLDRVMAIADGSREAPHWSREVYAKALNPEAAVRIALVAEDAEAGIIGFGITVLIPPQVELETIAVAASEQRKGIGTQIFHEIIAELKEARITEVSLEVRQSNRGAQALYHALGFVEIGRRHGYYADPEEDALLLQLSLS